MKFALVAGLILLVVSTISLAQIRYALSNPVSSIATILAIILEIGLIIYVAYHYISGENQTRGTFSLIGSKGGRATRRKSNLNYNGKNKGTSF